jgi:hypothetical protein
MLARNAGLRDTEIKTLTWGRVNLKARTLQVGMRMIPGLVENLAAWSRPPNTPRQYGYFAPRPWFRI